MLAGANPDMLTHLNSVATPMLRGLQQDVRYQRQQMATYADVMNPNSVEYHTTRANAAQAVTIAEIYLSLNGLTPNP